MYVFVNQVLIISRNQNAMLALEKMGDYNNRNLLKPSSPSSSAEEQ
jgi:hypothetical protein